MPHLILLRGVPGAGKTPVSAALAALIRDLDVVELDQIKERLYGTPLRCDDTDRVFGEAGQAARAALDAGRNVIVVEFFNREDLVTVTMRPTGLAIGSPRVVSCWLSCDVIEAVRRKHGRTPPDIVRQAHAAAAWRSAHPDEIVFDTTSMSSDDVARRLADALIKRGLREA